MKNNSGLRDKYTECGERNMEATETGKDKVRKICEILRKETLEPALDEAQVIIKEAKEKSNQIIEEAKSKAAKIISHAEGDIEKRETLFKASLNQAARQAVESLKEEIENKVLHHNLAKMLAHTTTKPQILADMIRAVVKGIEEEGLSTEISAIIPSAVEPRAVNELLGQDVLAKLKEKSVIVGPQKGGAELKLHDNRITIDLTDAAVMELLTRYLRKDFHQFFFQGK